MKIILLDPALQEFSDAVDFYNNESLGLGFEFADEIFHIIDRIKVYFSGSNTLVKKHFAGCRFWI